MTTDVLATHPVTSGTGAPHLGALDPLLRPRSVAVIGASRSPGAIGHQVLDNLLRCGFTGPVYPVNPHAVAVHSVRAYPSVGAIGNHVDLAVVVVPKDHVLEVAEQCGVAGVRGLVVISAGFRETGPAGAALEQQLRGVVQRHGMRMIGPNCMGVLNSDPAVALNATFAPAMPPHGRAAFVSQSGALGMSVLDFARELGIGISQFVSMGNKADVSGNDLLLQWRDDPGVGVILMYVESFGNPRRFLEIASQVTRDKPIIAVKAGRSRVGARAAASHTGALAASDAAVDALLAQAGVQRAETVEELFDLAAAFTDRALPDSPRTAVLTNSGGPGILAADALERVGLEVASLAQDTVDRIAPLFPSEASIHNPLDMLVSAMPPQYRAALEALLDDPKIDSALAIFVPPFGVRQEDVAEALVRAARGRPTKPVLAVLMGHDGLPQGRAELHRAGIPAYVFPESAARALAALWRHRQRRERAIVAEPPPLAVDRGAASHLVAAARNAHRKTLGEREALNLLTAYDIAVAPARVALGPDDAVAAAEAVGYPVALKISSPDVLHKTDVGGVILGITSAAELRIAYERLLADVERQIPGARRSGVLVQRQIAGGRELIVGFTRDASFGPLVMFGLGGVYVEALRDVVFRLAPLGRQDAADMVAGIHGTALLGALRGQPPVDRDALVDVLLRVSQLAVDHPAIAELDVNPLLALPQGAVALDARVVLTSS